MDIRAAIVIPTYNRPELLKRAVASAMAQTVQPYEIVVVNDCPSCDVRRVLPPGVKLINTTGGTGPGKARNLGISRLALSNAVTYLDDDDELLENHVATLSEALEAGAPFAFSKALYRYDDGFETEDPEPGNCSPDKAYYRPEAIFRQNIAPVSSFMHTVEASDAVGGWDASVLRMEDWDFWARMAVQHGPPAFCDAVTNVIHKGPGVNRTTSNPFVYSYSCSWRDIVADRIARLRKKGSGRVASRSSTDLLRMPRVGVVMPVYNAEATLAEALGSVLSQTFRDFEVLAVNDGSTDASASILWEHAKKDPRVRIFNTMRNAGVSAALNLGLLVSRSELIARMDADDVSLPTRFEEQVRFLDGNPRVGILGTYFHSMDPSLKTLVWDNVVPQRHAEICATLKDHCCIGHPTVMMRRAVVEALGGYSEAPEHRHVEDYEFWLRASHSVELANLPKVLLRHRVHDGQVSSNNAVQKENARRLKETRA